MFLLVSRLREVEEAKELMTEAMGWSVFTWLFQKSRVRKTADRANAALDKLKRAVKSRWSDEVKTAYQEVTAKARPPQSSHAAVETINPEIRNFVKKMKQADDAARRTRAEAEETFDEAERQLNTDLAREGCRKAIQQWELDEKAIRRAEAAPRSVRAAS